jgi:hypothetical protein
MGVKPIARLQESQGWIDRLKRYCVALTQKWARFEWASCALDPPAGAHHYLQVLRGRGGRA